MATLRQKKYHLCNCEHCNKRSNCFLCNETKGLHRAHLIPQHLLRALIEDSTQKEEMLSFEGHNVIALCPKHHKVFDKFDLPIEDWGKIKVVLDPLIEEFVKLASNNSVMTRGVKSLESWSDKTNQHLYRHKTVRFTFTPRI